jgi:hypothetical protein
MASRPLATVAENDEHVALRNREVIRDAPVFTSPPFLREVLPSRDDIVVNHHNRITFGFGFISRLKVCVKVIQRLFLLSQIRLTSSD